MNENKFHILQGYLPDDICGIPIQLSVDVITEKIFNSISLTLSDIGFVLPVFTIIKGDEFIQPIPMVSISAKEYCQKVIEIIEETKSDASILVCEFFEINKNKIMVEASNLDHSKKYNKYLVGTYALSSGKTRTLLAKIKKDLIGTNYINNKEWTDIPIELITWYPNQTKQLNS